MRTPFACSVNGPFTLLLKEGALHGAPGVEWIARRRRAQGLGRLREFAFLPQRIRLRHKPLRLRNRHRRRGRIRRARDHAHLRIRRARVRHGTRTRRERPQPPVQRERAVRPAAHAETPDRTTLPFRRRPADPHLALARTPLPHDAPIHVRAHGCDRFGIRHVPRPRREHAGERGLHHIAAVVRRAGACRQQRGPENYLHSTSHRLLLVKDGSQPWPVQGHRHAP